MREIGLITDGAILCQEGKIAWVGRDVDFSASVPDDMTVMDAGGHVAFPGFVDAHTHMLFAGDRAGEFALRCAGATYQQIAEEGGGIRSTVRNVRAATKKNLKRTTSAFLTDALRHGTTTVEMKSGYGLSQEAEITMLEAICELRDEELAGVVPTFLGAHAVPPEFEGDTEGYVRMVIERMLPYVARKSLAVFCDVFCERGYFDLDQTERILTAAASLGLTPKMHADELTPLGGTELGVRLGAISVDHLEHVSDTGIDALTSAGIVAGLLPGVSFFLNHRYAPARRLIDAGAPVAIASDFNPGSCMSYSMPLMMTIACTQMGMTPEEAITAATLHGAAALGLAASHGSIEAGKAADIVLARISDYRVLPYHFGTNHIRTVIKNGTILEL